jgi:hypothetical protein
LDELLDISTEIDLINEIKDVHDEPVMIESVLITQGEVLEQMEDLFTYKMSIANNAFPCRLSTNPTRLWRVLSSVN